MTTDIDPLLRFRCGTHEEVIGFAAQSRRIADLARTHPILFVALATGFGDPERRAAAITAALAGRRLRVVCDLAAIPYCLRSVPIELCPAPLPPAHWSADASPILAQFIPDDPMTLCNWVPGIFFANGAAGEAFSLWLAMRHELFPHRSLDHRRLLPIALYSWFAQHPEHELHSLIPARWSMRSGSRRVLNAVRAWLYRICCRIYLPGSQGSKREAVPFPIDKFRAFELTDFRALLAEQQVMDNCLDRYGRRIGSGTHAVFSLRTHAGVRVANFEVAIQAPDGPLVTEIRGRSNGEVSSDINDAVLRWVAASSHILRRPPVEQREGQIDPEDIFAKLIAPYVEAHQEALAAYGPVTLHGLERHVSVLAERLGVESWPVRFERTTCA